MGGGTEPGQDRKTEGGAAVLFAFELDPPAHVFHQLFADGKAQSGTTITPGDRAVGLAERLEKLWLLLTRNADAGIAHDKKHLEATCGLGTTQDFEVHAAVAGELHRVAQQVDQHLAQAGFVLLEKFRQVWRYLGIELQSFGLRLRQNQRDDLLHQIRHPERHLLELETAGLDFGKVENVVDQSQEGIATGADGFDEGPLFLLQGGAEQNPRHADHRVHRRADFVAHVGQKRRLGPVGLERLPLRNLESRDGFGERGSALLNPFLEQFVDLFEPPEAPRHQATYQGDEGDGRKNLHGEVAPPRRHHADLEPGALLVPNPGAARGLDPEKVPARLEVGIPRLIARASGDPVRIHTFEAVGVPIFLRLIEMERREVDCQVPIAPG